MTRFVLVLQKLAITIRQSHDVRWLDSENVAQSKCSIPSYSDQRSKVNTLRDLSTVNEPLRELAMQCSLLDLGDFIGTPCHWVLWRQLDLSHLARWLDQVVLGRISPQSQNSISSTLDSRIRPTGFAHRINPAVELNLR